MNDWWNDPPEEPEETGEEPAQVQYDSLEEYALDQGELADQPVPPNCPHGNQWGSCDRCDFEGDIAYDARREK
jgi:hypothetical protein